MGELKPDVDLQALSHEEPKLLEWDTAPLGETLWGVYGPDCLPTVFACILRDYPDHGRAIWGYSVYEGEPGFRTLGSGKLWADGHDLRLFRTRSEAFAHIAALFPEDDQHSDGGRG